MPPEAPSEAPSAPVAPAEVVQPKVAPLNSNIPLSQQTGKIMKMMESLPEKKEEAPAEVKPEVKEQPIETPPEVPAESYFEEEDETPEVTPFEVKTWQEYVAASVKPITVIGKIGEELREFKVYSEEQLPADFQFQSQVDQLKYSRAFDRLERQAESKQQEFFQKQNQENVRQFEIQESKDIASDLKWLQSRGIVPKFQYDETDSRFNSDEAVKEANAIYDLYKQTNNEYAQRYMGSNRSYRISYRDAADKYYATKGRTAPKEAPKIDKPTEKTPIQKQRDTIGNRVGAPQGGEAQTIKPRAFAGMTNADIMRLVKAGKI